MNKLPIALQLYSVREEMQKDFENTVRQVRSYGYDGVEFAGLFGRSAKNVKELLSSEGLFPVSAHVSLEELLKDPEKTLETYKEIGCPYIAVPYLEEERRLGGERYGETLEDFKKIGEKAKEYKMQLLYHNHSFEFQKKEGSCFFDTLFQAVSSEYLQAEIDTCWVKIAGENPSEYLLKYKGRVPLMHLKDFIKEGVLSEGSYRLLPSDQHVNEDRPAGYGVQNIPLLLKSGEEAGVRYVIVEQDSPSESLHKTAMECAKMSIDYLKSL